MNNIDILKSKYMEPEMSEEQVAALKSKMARAKSENRRERKKARFVKAAAAAATVAAMFVILPNTSATVAHAMVQIPLLGELVQVVTFRDYSYEDERHIAHVEVPEIKVDNLGGSEANLEPVTDEINREIQQITDDLIAEFKKSIADREDYQEIIVNSEVLTATDEYFTLKLMCYRGAGSGYQWNYYYTIDLKTGERMKLADAFVEGADYITPISENIKAQMEEQMAADEMVHYWLHDEIEEWNFKTITPETSFYINEQGNVVIGFDEGDVAPMYMGAVEFEIPGEVLAGIRK